MTDKDQYSRYFSVGMKIGVGIPMNNNELFRDWAVILEIEEDLVRIQLSRDVLPVDVDLQTGKTLELRCGKEGKGYRCSGVYISEEEAGIVQLRLTGDVNSNELREYYRIEAFLPFRLQISHDHNMDAVLKEWRTRKQNRLSYESQRKKELEQKRRDLLYRTAEGEFDADDRESGETVTREPEELEFIDHSWDDSIALAVNLSAGGFKFVTAERYEIGDLVFQEIFIPTNPPRTMDSVARVVFKNHNYSAGSDKEYFNVAMQFMLIDERDRDAIVSHISNLELMRIRLMRLTPIPIERLGSRNMFTPFRMIGTALLLLTIVILIVYYFQQYLHYNIRNEIAETFENGIRKYLDRFK
jgi:hypothetical protein